MSRKILFLLSLTLFTHVLAAQTRLVKGQLVDAQTAEPLPFAVVKLDGVDGGTLTDTAGAFTLSLQTGRSPIKIKVTLAGYMAQTFAVDTHLLVRQPTPSTVYLLPATLSLQPLTLQEVVISGTLKEVSRDASPVPIEVYTPKFFSRNPTPSLFDALQIVNGVQPQLNCNVCNTGDIHINGLEGPYTMVTIDGMPIVSALSTVYGLSGIPNSMVERLEIVKGPASTLYGSEAVGGLINVITKRPESAPRFSLDMSSTSYGEHNADLGTAFRLGKVSGLVSASGFWFDQRHDVNGDNFTDMTLQKRVSAFSKWSLERRENLPATLAVRYVWENRWGGELQWEPRWAGTDSIYGESILTRRLETLGKYRLPGRENLLLSFSYTAHRQDSYYGAKRFDALQQIGFTQLTWDKPLAERHDLLVGAAWRYTWYDDNTLVTATPEGNNQPSRVGLPGLFVQHEWDIGKKHVLLSGLRYDQHPVHGTVWSPRINWKWSVDALNTLRLGVGNGFRVANVFSEEHAALTGSRAVLLAADLKPERSWNANLNYVTKFFPAFGFVGVDASLFFTYFSNRILADYATDPNLVIFNNLAGYGVSRGLTLNTDWNAKNGLKIMAGATFQQVFTRENGTRAAQVHAPPLMATWSATYPLPRWHLSVDYTGNLYSPMPLPTVPNDFRSDHSPWFSIQNVQVTWKIWGDVEVYAGVKNLLNFLPHDPLLRPFDPFDKQVNDPVNNPFGYTFDTTYNYAPMQGRRAFVGMRWKW